MMQVTDPKVHMGQITAGEAREYGVLNRVTDEGAQLSAAVGG